MARNADPPFVTPVSTLAWCLVCFAAAGVEGLVFPTSGDPAPGLPAFLGAASYALFEVSVLVTWICGFVLAYRRRSVPLGLVAILPVLGAFFIALVIRGRTGKAAS